MYTPVAQVFSFSNHSLCSLSFCVTVVNKKLDLNVAVKIPLVHEGKCTHV